MEDPQPFPASFGDLLKAYRTQQGVTQRQLADKLGLHQNTVGAWERGDYLPATRGLVLELARCLRLDEARTSHLLEASLLVVTPRWSVPLPRNPCFTGREEVLAALHTQLGHEQTIALTQSAALHGLGGVGKTQIALEYAYRHALEYSAVCWVGAETEEQIVASLLHLADVLQVPERADQDQQRVIAAVQRWLSAHRGWLLIWDNVEDLDLLDRYLPPARQGAILLTTRLQALGTRAQGLDLLPMDHEEGLLFLLRRAKLLAPDASSEDVRQLAVQMPAHHAAAEELVHEMGGLPLALDQAGAYLEATQCGLAAYRDLFGTRRAALLQQRGAGVRDHPASVTTTFTLALAATASRHPAAGDLLRVCALLQADAIPEALFRQGGAHLGATLAAVCGDSLEWNRAVAAACAYSLLSRHPEAQTLSVHRLVQAIMLETMPQAERAAWKARVLAALEAVFPAVGETIAYAAWQQGERLLPHAQLCLQRAETASETLVLASLAHKVAQYLRMRGRYAEAEPLFERALQMREQRLGPDHPEVADVLNGLALLSWKQGQYARAEALYWRVLPIREQALGAAHPLVGLSLNNLGILYWQQGRYAQAEPLLQRALRIQEQALGSDHPNVALTLSNLGLLYKKQGRYAEAEPLLQRALHTSEQTLGLDHPGVAIPLDNLASLYQEQGRSAEAEPLFARALHTSEQTLGLDHPGLTPPLTDLAELYTQQGRYAEAEPLFARALQIREQAVGANHPDVAESLHGLATLSRAQGQEAEAERLYQRALAIREQQLGLHHPETAHTLHELARLRQQQGRLGEALALAERALAIRSQTLGEAHPKTAASQALWTQLRQQQASAKVAAAARGASSRSAEASAEGIAVPLPAAADPAGGEPDPLQAFLCACCELHPRAWSRASDLWRAYTQWAAHTQERFPLSRRAFTQQLKAHGFRADRTNTARIWRGVAVVDKAW